MTTQSAVWTIRDLLMWATPYLQQKGSQSPRLDVELLLSQILGLKRIDLYVQFERILTPEERGAFRACLQRRGQGEPMAYILGHKDFMSHRFVVTPEVLIPRCDTECLVEAVLGDFPLESVLRVLDVGTGSGCILLSLLKARPAFSGTGWDISEGALAVARENARQLEVSNQQGAFFLRDMADPEAWKASDPVEIIVSNPPYIGWEEKAALSGSVVDHEPHAALFAEDSGVFFYKRLEENAGYALLAGGKIYLEIGHTQAEGVAEIFSTPRWREPRFVKDLQGISRVFIATYQG